MTAKNTDIETLIAVINERQDQHDKALRNLCEQIKIIQADVRALLINEAGRSNYFNGMRFGAQFALLATAAAGGAAVKELWNWLLKLH